MRQKAVVTGLGVISPVGNDVPTFWESICAGRSGVTPIRSFDASLLPTRIAGQVEGDLAPPDLSNKDIRRRDRCTLFALVAADQAWSQSGIDINRENPERCGVVLGTGVGGITTLEDGHSSYLQGGHRSIPPITVPKMLLNIAAGEVGIRLGLRGPNKTIVTACASAAQSIAEAVRMIWSEQVDLVVAGGSEAPLTGYGIGGFCAMKALSRRNEEPHRASRPFDAERDGFVMSEGAGILVLESETHARERGAAILAEVNGFGESCDAYHITAPRPDGSGAASAMKSALRSAEMNPEDIGYFNAHGTSTKHNDAAETLALQSVFGAQMPPVSSTKSMMGHLLGAAGAVEAIVCILAIQHSVLPPNINYEHPDPECMVNLVANEAKGARIDTTMSNSLGFGGHNASLIIRRYG